MPRVLTHSAMARFRECPRRYYYEYVLLLRPVEDTAAMRRGRLVHELLEIMAKQGIDAVRPASELMNVADRYVLATAVALVFAYYETYKDCNIVESTIAAEHVFEMPLQHVVDGVQRGISRTWAMGGKIDRIVKLVDGRNSILECKTIGRTPDERYFLRLMMDPQISLYLLAAKRTFPELAIDTIIYDVVRWPAMSPLLATPLEKRKYTKDGKLYASMRETDEPPQEWYERLYADIMQRPEFYLQRREVPRLVSDLDVFLMECWDLGRMIREAELKNRWWRNVGTHCERCPHFFHCCGVVDLEQTPIPDGFVRLDTINPELEEVA